MSSSNFVLKGQICHSLSAQQTELVENGYLVCQNGISAGVFTELPEQFSDYELIDYGNRLIIPGLVDLHIHAPQYGFRGLGMDLELLDWLNEVTFPEEAKYADQDYAENGYRIFAEEMKRSATTRACIFATIHTAATIRLMELLEDTGLRTMVGKVNMDRNSPDILREEDARASLQDTLKWLELTSRQFENVKPILTPRFIPSCTDELMKGLDAIRRQYQLPVHSHLSENPGEVEWVRELCPKAKSYGDAYAGFGMFGGDCQTLMAHCVYLTDEEMKTMKENQVYIAHCPQSNTNLSSGIAPVRKFLDLGIKTGLGSDVGGGHTPNIFRAMADAIQVSKLYWRLVDQTTKPLTVEEAFYLGTKGGGEFFGNVGSFEAGYELDVLVLDDLAIRTPKQLSLAERLERMIYLADEHCILAKYVAGNQVF